MAASAALAGVLIAVLIFLPAITSHSSAPKASSALPGRSSPLAVDPEFLPDIFTSTESTLHGEFGESLAVSGSTLVVGAPNEQEYIGGIYYDGQVHVENLANGSSSVLLPNETAAAGSYGWSVAIGGGLIVVGAPGEGFATSTPYTTGHVFVFNATTHAQVAVLSSPNAQVWYNDSRDWTDEFGASVAVGNGYIVVGAPGENASGWLAAGHVYVINASTGATRMLESPYPQGGGFFGRSVAISGNYIVVGAPGEALGTGNAYVYSATTGDLIEQLTYPFISFAADFGFSVAIDWPYVAIGAPYQDVNYAASGSGQCGAVFLFYLPTAGFLNLVASPSATLDGEFGESVALGPSLLLVGAPHEDPHSSAWAGDTFLFSLSSPQLIQSDFVAPEWPSGATFGAAVALTPTAVFVGAPNESAGGAAGAGHAYEFSEIPLSYASPASSGAANSGGFGDSVAIDEGILAIGASNETVSGLAGAGRAYLVPSEPGPIVTFAGNATGENFGAAVAVTPTYFAVGAPGAQGGDGAVYVFNTSYGTRDRTILPPAPEPYRYGDSLSISGDLLAIGGPGFQGGLVEVYNLSSGNRVNEFVDGTLGSAFGSSVALSGTTLVVGAPQYLHSNGTAYIVSNVIGTSPIYSMSDPNFLGGQFGAAVAIGGTSVVVGAPEDDAGIGEAYVFSTTGQLEYALTDPNVTSGAMFGDAVADNGATIVVGAEGETAFGTVGAGNIFLYSMGVGRVTDRYNSPAPVSNGSFGVAAAIGPGGTILIGSVLGASADPYVSGASWTAFLFFS
jgi:hypothetical protein